MDLLSKANTIQLDSTMFINQPPKRNKYNQNHAWSSGSLPSPRKVQTIHVCTYMKSEGFQESG